MMYFKLPISALGESKDSEGDFQGLLLGPMECVRGRCDRDFGSWCRHVWRWRDGWQIGHQGAGKKLRYT